MYVRGIPPQPVVPRGLRNQRDRSIFDCLREQDEVCVSTSKQVEEQRQKQDGFGASVRARVLPQAPKVF